MKIKRPKKKRKIIITIALRTLSNGHLSNNTWSDMEYMLEYDKINYNSVQLIIDETSDYVAGVIPTLEDTTCTDLDIIVKLTDLNPQALRRLDLDAYTSGLRNNRRQPITSEEHELCPICYRVLGTDGEISYFICNHFYHHQCVLGWIKVNLTFPICRKNLG
ncbi:unnamed protein product [Eruca vesicaria subsp. sativa]|uniref:RING-type domain-containing protein n=1 Tax=Eruca vesicaria subsp. sativa TaxID=29727 RepID=A0ABC8KYH6_ERUVS|nr:unnamed protein product [Eruca vesicaria subsp. sativa]